MKTTLFYLIIVATMLLSACSGSATASTSTSKAAVTPATSSTSKVAATPATSASTTTQTQSQPDQPPTAKSEAAGQGQQAGGGTPPAAAIAACADKAEQATCEFAWEKGTETGVCEMVQNQLACSPQRGPANGDQPGKGGNQSGGGTTGITEGEQPAEWRARCRTT